MEGRRKRKVEMQVWKSGVILVMVASYGKERVRPSVIIWFLFSPKFRTKPGQRVISFTCTHHKPYDFYFWSSYKVFWSQVIHSLSIHNKNNHDFIFYHLKLTLCLYFYYDKNLNIIKVRKKKVRLSKYGLTQDWTKKSGLNSDYFLWVKNFVV